MKANYQGVYRAEFGTYWLVTQGLQLGWSPARKGERSTKFIRMAIAVCRRTKCDSSAKIAKVMAAIQMHRAVDWPLVCECIQFFTAKCCS